MEVLRLLVGTVLLRPYVFVFLAAFLALAVPAWGWRRTGLYVVLGYVLAWLAEYSAPQMVHLRPKTCFMDSIAPICDSHDVMAGTVPLSRAQATCQLSTPYNVKSKVIRDEIVL